MKTSETPVAFLTFVLLDNILHIQVKEGAEMNLENTIIHYEKINQLVGNQNYFALVDASNCYTIEEAAWQYSLKSEIISNRRADAYYNPSLSNRLATVYFVRTFKTPVPLKIFNSKEKAVQWLKSIKIIE